MVIFVIVAIIVAIAAFIVIMYLLLSVVGQPGIAYAISDTDVTNMIRHVYGVS
jgi:membrane-anchored glycerophosphoryl diester phosphodiesterase (GDPDase)